MKKSEKNIQVINTNTLVLKLIEEQDMYGYEMINTLKKRSDETFHLKAGTLYPILHGLEKDGLVESYEKKADSGERIRKYYHMTKYGRKILKQREQEWAVYYTSVNKVLSYSGGGKSYVTT